MFAHKQETWITAIEGWVSKVVKTHCLEHLNMKTNQLKQEPL